MDALAMTFEDQSFDVLIDKGTLDALCCGQGITVPVNFLTEAMRVCKIGGLIFVISCGNEAKRRSIYREVFGNGKAEVYMKKQELSKTSNLINIMKSMGMTSPKDVIKNPEGLKKALVKRKSLSLLYLYTLYCLRVEGSLSMGLTRLSVVGFLVEEDEKVEGRGG